ncbi:NADP-dependent oxidoreductase [Chitinophaga parva]|uniref:NADP-dependent oxidoreductase n=1 Tax=Chitinophaga parva TaxID=2169414 RepID=A0A2T7BEH2_9BACT|nr:NADP-dependent oxidoreductase [Chitinophaga parva]PUZ23475.1 NADP-dependent oxidoreductase [Chitinophaga parva]
MKAIRIHEFGGPEVMKMETVARPVPAAGEILVKVYAASVNPADYVIREGGNDFLRPYLQLPMGLGIDLAGVVEAVGAGVENFKPGDRVYGLPNFLDGAYTEYLAARATQFARMPGTATFNEAAAMASCASIAWNGVMELGNVQAGQRILIHGAAGGVGNMALQFAKSRGAYVIGTASAHNFDFLRSLGADEVVDYKDENFETLLHDVTVVFNASPVRDAAMRMKSVQVMQEGGIFVCTQVDFPFSEAFINALAAKQATATFIGGTNLDFGYRLAEVATLVDEGKVKAVISKVYPWEEVAAAHRESETRHVRGKIVLEIRKEEEI